MDSRRSARRNTVSHQIHCRNDLRKVVKNTINLNNKSRRNKLSSMQYANIVLKQSSFNAVSAIASTTNTFRKLFRLVCLLLFIIGFIYQLIVFLLLYLEYPTIVDIEIGKKPHYLSPAYSFCNSNKIKRSKFCELYPSRCVVADETFCAEYQKYCADGNGSIPEKQFFLPENIPYEDTLVLGHDVEDFFSADELEDAYEIPEGPFPFLREQIENYSDFLQCYTLYSRVNNSLDAIFLDTEGWRSEKIHKLNFNPEEQELFNPKSEVGMYFAVHSQFDSINPLEDGVFLKPGYFYRVRVTVQEEELMPYPYRTDCVNYTERWLKNGRIGPRSKLMCTDVAYQRFAEICYGCVEEGTLYPTNTEICSNATRKHYCEDDMKLSKELKDWFDSEKECKKECFKTKYQYNVQETFINPKWSSENLENETTYIQVKVQIDESEIVTLTYKPRYEDIETFSYIGGFLGVWLGVSLVQMADIIESLFRIARHFIRLKFVTKVYAFPR